MARRLLSLDVTGTLIRVRGSVGEIYVSLCYDTSNVVYITYNYCFVQSKAARDILGISREQADPVQLDKSFKLVE